MMLTPAQQTALEILCADEPADGYLGHRYVEHIRGGWVLPTNAGRPQMLALYRMGLADRDADPYSSHGAMFYSENKAGQDYLRQQGESVDG